jgi:hypothetical protein
MSTDSPSPVASASISKNWHRVVSGCRLARYRHRNERASLIQCFLGWTLALSLLPHEAGARKSRSR